ncbi:MAG: sulfatase-like hydrolase/transferase [Aerococcaceae bacterium]|nr:sulfatase-like hydrolase/transferase [Aerococcaceae bacterium]
MEKWSKLFKGFFCVLLWFSFIWLFRNEFLIGGKSEIVIEASQEHNALSRDAKQTLRGFKLNGQHISEHKIETDFYTYTVVDPEYFADGKGERLTFKVPRIKTLQFEYVKMPVTGVLKIYFNGNLYREIDTYNVLWERHDLLVEFPMRIGIDQSNFWWWLFALIGVIATYYVMRDKKIPRAYYVAYGVLGIVSFAVIQCFRELFPIRIWNTDFGFYTIWAAGMCMVAIVAIVLWWLEGFLHLRRRKGMFVLLNGAIVSCLAMYFIESGYSRFVYLLPRSYLFNWIIWMCLYLFIYWVFQQVLVANVLIFVSAVILGIVNSVLIETRQTPLLLYNLKQIRTALTVTDKVEYQLTTNQIVLIVISLFVLMILLLSPISTQKFSWKRLGIRWVKAAVMATLSVTLIFPQIISRANIPLDYWRSQYTYSKYGFMLSLLAFDAESKIDKPQDYSLSAVEQILSQYPRYATKNTTYPNIIVIQNESQVDFSNLEGLKLSPDPLAFQHSLAKNMPHGRLNVSVFGGGTANTEYEFLTGNSNATLLNGMFPYQQVVTRSQYSIVDFLEHYGYETTAIHPYQAYNYNRDTVYRHFGFNHAYFLDGEQTIAEFMEPEYERRFVTDKSLFKGIANLYENKGTAPLFTFVVTMQGHGGYKDPNYKTEVDLNLPEEQSQAERIFLTSLKKTDAAFKELVEYFETFREPTVILMYGDHQPTLSDGFYEQFMDSQDKSAKYTVPYIVWSNFPIEAPEGPTTFSPNFLTPYLLKTLENSEYSLPIPSYYQFLWEVMQETPVYTTWGYKLPDGTFQSEMDSKLYQDYLKVEYQNVFDSFKLPDFYY